MAEFKTNRITTVEILGSEYHLTGGDETYLRDVAQYVDTQLKSCCEDGLTYSTGNLGILACLNISEQLLKAKEDYGKNLSQILKTVNCLIEKIDAHLGVLENSSGQKETLLGI